MEGLNFDNIYGEQEIDTLFSDVEDISPEETGGKGPEEKAPEEKIDGKETTEVEKPEDLFGDEELTQPESVGSGDDKEVKGDAATKGSDTSPNFYSSIANALAVDGIFLNSDEETVSKVDSAESLSDLIEAEINSRLDEKQQRISKALENGVEPSDIRKYEAVLGNISRINDAILAEESEKGEQLRKDLIYQDYLNRGYSQERAQKFTERSIDAGTDVEDAKAALQSNKEFFQSKYNDLLAEAQEEADRIKEERTKQANQLKESIYKDKKLFGDTEISQDVRKKIFDSISKPIYKNPETGEYLTAVQKYEMEHPAEFLKYVGLFMTLTDNFKDFKSFAKAEVRKEMKKGLRELENTLNNTRRTSGGALKMVANRKEDPESFLGGNFKLAL